MIRRATPGDVCAIAALGAGFHDLAGWSDVAGYSAADCEASLRWMIDSADAVLLVAECDGDVVGMAGGIAAPLYFNFAHKHGQELFFFIAPEHRGFGGALLDALEAEARVIGCASWQMIALDRVNPEATGRLYQRRGYRASEHSFIKRL